MKKMMIAAMMLVSASTAFAQDLVKQITKEKDYATASNLLQANLGSLTAEQKAKCYNALVDLNASGFNKAYESFVLNQQMGKNDKEEIWSLPSRESRTRWSAISTTTNPTIREKLLRSLQRRMLAVWLPTVFFDFRWTGSAGSW